MQLKKPLPSRRIKGSGSKKQMLLFLLFLPFLISSVLALLFFLQSRASFLHPVPEGSQQQNIADDQQKLIKDLLREQKIAFQQIVSQPDGSYSIFLDDRQEVIVTLEKPLNRQISSLQLISNQLTMERKRFSRLDLRYDKPVIVLE